MASALAEKAQPVLLDLHALLRELEALHSPHAWVGERVSALRERVSALFAGDDELGREIRALAELLSEGGWADAETWRDRRKRLQVLYDTLCGNLQAEALELPLHRPNN